MAIPKRHIMEHANPAKVADEIIDLINLPKRLRPNGQPFDQTVFDVGVILTLATYKAAGFAATKRYWLNHPRATRKRD